MNLKIIFLCALFLVNGSFMQGVHAFTIKDQRIEYLQKWEPEKSPPSKFWDIPNISVSYFNQGVNLSFSDGLPNQTNGANSLGWSLLPFPIEFNNLTGIEYKMNFAINDDSFLSVAIGKGDSTQKQVFREEAPSTREYEYISNLSYEFVNFSYSYQFKKGDFELLNSKVPYRLLVLAGIGTSSSIFSLDADTYYGGLPYRKYEDLRYVRRYSRSSTNYEFGFELKGRVSRKILVTSQLLYTWAEFGGFSDQHNAESTFPSFNINGLKYSFGIELEI